MKKKLISRRVLRTELNMAMTCIERMNYGYARDIIQQVLDRVMEYDLNGNVNEGRQ